MQNTPTAKVWSEVADRLREEKLKIGKQSLYLYNKARLTWMGLRFSSEARAEPVMAEMFDFL